MGCSISRINEDKINLLEKEKNFLKIDLTNLQNIQISSEDYIVFQEKVMIPNGELFRYKYEKILPVNNLEQCKETAYIYFSVHLGEKLNKQNALELLENNYIKPKITQIEILKCIKNWEI